jgi:putative nucleotidyltransferase with HDIG domain
VGKPWVHDDLIAPTNFAILKSEIMLQTDKEIVMNEQDFYFYQDTAAVSKGKQDIENVLNEVLPVAKVSLTMEKKYIKHAWEVYEAIMKKGIIEAPSVLSEKPEQSVIVSMSDNRAYNAQIKDFYTKEQAYWALDSAMNMDKNYERRYLEPVIKAVLLPNVVYNKEFTENMLQQQLNNISLTNGVVQSGELIIGKGAIVTEEKERILNSFQSNYVQSYDFYNYLMKILGQTITAILSLLVLALYLYLFKKEVFWNNRNVALGLFVIVLMLLAATIAVRFGDEYIYAIPICLTPVLMTTFFGARTALFAHIALLLNTGFIVMNGFEFMFIQMLAGIMTIFSIIKLQKRAQVLKMMVLVFFTYIVATVGFTLIKTGNLHFPNINMFVYFAISSGLLIISYPLFYVFERTFGIVTDVTLMELSDTNNKLLRELSTKAPGTFQHSNQVANLAEEAAYAIGANPMLTRAGAWYHDIGKIENPSFFIENQMNEKNPHTALSNQESAKIIIEHVAKGVEIARKHHLPQQIIDFIRMHHGVRQTSYFYRMEKNEKQTVDAALFTYAGPIPDSKEMALIMMADSVEATSRSLKSPTEENIMQMVSNIINELIAEHQLDNADITMKDIGVVKKLFTKRLMNIYHVRIAYPEEKIV